jgi:zinc/manganese transport system substrate-binding protein
MFLALHTGRSRPLAVALGAVAIGLVLAGCGRSSLIPRAAPGQIIAVGAENQYADVISQIGGKYVAVSAIESNPNTDPHSYEASPSVAQAVQAARIVVQNGLGYDEFMNRIESAAPDPNRAVIDVQSLLGLPDSTPNPHLWYSPMTMPAVATALVHALTKLQPSHAAYFAANAKRFDASLQPWLGTLAALRSEHPSAPVATTEPVGDYLLQAAGAKNLTPWSLQADVMNGVDPAPQDVTLQRNLFANGKVKAFLYNEQVTDTLTESFLSDATRNHVPVVSVYETMPAGYHYQSWMLAETRALARAISDGVSTRKL